MDLRGHGESEWADDGDYEIEAFAADLHAVAADLPSAPALVGASLGGMAAWSPSGSRRRRPSCSSTSLRAWIPGVGRIVGFMTARPEGFATIDEAADAIAAYLPHRPRPSDTSGLAKNLRQATTAAGAGTGIRASCRPAPQRPGALPRPHEAAARSLKVPVMLVRGRMSEVVSEEGVREFLEMVPQAEYVDIEDASHMVAGDRNDLFCDAVVDFLKRTLTPKRA